MMLTDDLLEWVLADRQVCERWRSLAVRLHLDHLLPLDRFNTDTDQMRGLLHLWREERPGQYNVRGLKSVLAMEGLHDMWMWITLITQDTAIKSEITEAISRNLSTCSVTSPRDDHRWQPWHSSWSATTSSRSSSLYTPPPPPQSSSLHGGHARYKEHNNDILRSLSLGSDCSSQPSSPESSPASPSHSYQHHNQTSHSFQINCTSLASPSKSHQSRKEDPYGDPSRPDLIKLSSPVRSNKTAALAHLKPEVFKGTIENTEDGENRRYFKSSMKIQLKPFINDSHKK